MSPTTDTTIKKGLDGVVVDESKVSKVMPEINSLVYRGYKVQDLAENCTFEEVAYLLWHDDLPSKNQLAAFTEKERGQRDLSDSLKKSIALYPKSAHPMDTVRSGVSYLGMEETEMWKSDHETNLRKSISLLSKIPTVVANDYRCRKGKSPIPPRKDLSISENFFHMCFGEVPAKEVVRAFDVSLILYAEHGFNASTFTARVITSSKADLHSAVTGAIGSLKGPLHGGANEQVMHVLKEIGDPAKAKAWITDAIATKKTIMGFGHRVYKSGDSRVPTMKKYAVKMAEVKGDMRWTKISDVLEAEMVAQKNIHPNLDFPAGPAYYLMGFDIDMFTPIFVIARITGWCAHIMEQAEANRLIRPLCDYTGSKERAVKALSARG